MKTIESRMCRPWKHEYRSLFLLGGLIGVLCFICVYGVQILDFSYTAWLMNGDIDLRQHYLGWCHYRNSDWHLPIGLIDSLLYPTSVSVIWTDSIPLFAVFFKLFRSILPETFQYFGLFGLLSFAMQGGISTLLVRKLTDRKHLCLLMAPFFILSFTVLQRMYYHTALSAQWIILLALLIWFYCDTCSTVKKCGIWAAMGILCVSVHSYFVPMVGLIMLGSLADDVLKCKEKKKAAIHAIVTVASYCAAVLAMLFLLGAFYEDASPVGEGIGTFGSNLNTFVNPLEHSALFSGLPLYYDFQYEGFGYLGAGMLMLGIGAVCILAYTWNKKKVHISKAFLYRHSSKVILLLVALLFFLLAVLPMVTIGSIKLVGIPYPAFIEKVMNIFRSNGRFIWIPMYIIMFGIIAIYIRYMPNNSINQKGRSGRNIILTVVLTFGLLLQLFDVSKMVFEKQNYFMKTEQTYESLWDEMDAENIANYKHFVFMYLENDWIMDTAYYAYYHDMTLNNYYYARSYDTQIEKEIARYRDEIAKGMIREDVIYIFREQDLQELSVPKELQLTEFDGHIIGTKYGI